jgi:hypothetical protein
MKTMKTMQILLVAIALGTCLFTGSGAAQAALIDRGGGLIFDTTHNITWLKDANYAKTSGYDADGRMTWAQATSWAANLHYYDSVHKKTLTGWRLPTTLELDPTCSAQHGDYSDGYNCTGSEIGYLYYNELGGVAGGSLAQNTNPFINIQSNSTGEYWSGTVHAPNLNDKLDYLQSSDPLRSLDYAWLFTVSFGYQRYAHQFATFSAWAVRDGDVATPIHLSPGESATIHFIFSAPPNSGVDYIRLGAAASGSSSGSSLTSQVDIFNGNTLLSTYQGSFSNLNYIGQWTAPGSLFSANLPLIDFTAIRNGSIDGKIILKNASLTGEVQFDPANIEVIVSTAVGPFATFTDAKQPVITSVVKNSNFVPPPPPAPTKLPLPVLPPDPPTTKVDAKRGLVLTVHGWKANSEDWPEKMVESIKSSIQANKSSNQNIDWTIGALDWGVEAAITDYTSTHVNLPMDAYANAEAIGKGLAKAIAAVGTYDYVHLIAHSAGSNVIHVATQWLRVNKNIKQPKIHLTFLDAYHPDPDNSTYGLSADWAEQYVDRSKLDYIYSVLGTDAILPNAFNFDITNWSARPSCPADVWRWMPCVHRWPYEWYQDSVNSSSSTTPYLFGYSRSIESGQPSLPGQNSFFKPGALCTLENTTSDCLPTISDTGTTIKFLPEAVVTTTSSFVKNVYKSATGLVSYVKGDVINLLTGSPVWITLELDLPMDISALQFDYQFGGAGEALLAVYIDNQRVYAADQRNGTGMMNRAGPFSVGVFSAGKHFLSFRLDNFDGPQSSIDLSGITIGHFALTPVLNKQPFAVAGDYRTVRVKSNVVLDGSGSYDPDGTSSSLGFKWWQVGGPTVSLSSSTDAHPSFTPLVRGKYVFNLSVNDGLIDSLPTSVVISVPALGDIDADGDVDTDDLAKINAALNQAASGPNDLRDLDGDGKITVLDARKLVLQCTRPRCTTK